MEKRGCFFIKPNFLRLVRVSEKMRSNFHISILEKGEHMNEELLTRLVEALESINNNLSDIAVSLDGLDKNIDGCVSCSRDGRSKYLCISGDVYTN